MTTEKEIVVIKALLALLNETLIMNLKSGKVKKANVMVSDIIKCKTELNRLIAIREKDQRGSK